MKYLYVIIYFCFFPESYIFADGAKYGRYKFTSIARISGAQSQPRTTKEWREGDIKGGRRADLASEAEEEQTDECHPHKAHTYDTSHDNPCLQATSHRDSWSDEEGDEIRSRERAYKEPARRRGKRIVGYLNRDEEQEGDTRQSEDQISVAVLPLGGVHHW